MKRTLLSKISKRQRAIKAGEEVLMAQMMKESDDLCWICKKRPAVEPSHTKDRKRFVPSCRACHTGGNKLGDHRYLEEK